VEELLKQKIELIIGPMTSSIAMAIVPQVNASSVILLSPTVTTTDLVGLDDNFLRVMSTTTEYGSKSARYQFQKLGIRTVAVLYDIGNRSYSESWLNEFRRAFEELGGKILLTRSFQSGDETLFRPLAEELLAVKADSVLIISNAVDSAMTCQQLRKLAPRQQIALSEWASTERFTELAGGTAEGVVVAQFMDRNDPSARYQEFLRAYRERFQQEPGFAGLAGYDAALVALEAYAGRKQGETLKHYIIAKKSFQGAQQLLNIDRFGDADRGTFVTIVRDKQYITVE
jgi:branched-chain amino acid transport system substrate-binding protein